MHYEVYYKNKYFRSDEKGGTTTPKQFPCVELVYNYDWDDMGSHNWYSIWYFEDAHRYNFVGDVKIMTRQEKSIAEALGDGFDGALDASFCSLGITAEYYSKIYSIFGAIGKVDEIMSELRDCAYDPMIFEDFFDDNEFRRSLWRDMTAQEARKLGNAFLHGLVPDNTYKFSYECNIIQPDESYQPITLRVGFPFDGPIYNRTMCIVGENGIGKTQLLYNLTRSLVRNEAGRFDRMPLFNGCIVINSTPFDNYHLEEDDSQCHYKNISIEQHIDKTEQDLEEAIDAIMDRPTVNARSMSTLYRETIIKHVGEIMSSVLLPQENPQFPDWIDYMLDKNELRRVVPILSSGQLHLLSLITHVYANIHFSTLMVIDEPEVHLHPHTIVAFMSVLASILERFKSFAIIATHSPLIVREVISSNVHVLQRVDNNVLHLSPVAYNTFGEDITTLYYKIFEYDINDSFFVDLIRKMIRNRMSYEQIVSHLQKDVELSLNARLTIRDLVEQRR